jgi:hypothetical protein
MGYIISYMQIFSDFFLKLKNMIFFSYLNHKITGTDVHQISILYWPPIKNKNNLYKISGKNSMVIISWEYFILVMWSVMWQTKNTSHVIFVAGVVLVRYLYESTTRMT